MSSRDCYVLTCLASNILSCLTSYVLSGLTSNVLSNCLASSDIGGGCALLGIDCLGGVGLFNFEGLIGVVDNLSEYDKGYLSTGIYS